MRAPIVPAPKTAAFSMRIVIGAPETAPAPKRRLQKCYRAGQPKNPCVLGQATIVIFTGTEVPGTRRTMGNVFRWLGTAVKGLRSFAYNLPLDRPRIGVALGGGFARGIAHIGVLRVLEESNIPVDLLAGTSVGALVGSAYAAGTSLSELEYQGMLTHFRDFGRWTISRMGMATNERLETYLRRFTSKRTFEELKIPLAIVATDIITGQTVYFTAGELARPLRASCAFPGLFMPVE